MLSRKLQTRILKRCYANIHRVTRHPRHFSCLCRRSKIIAFGIAQKARTHTKTARWFPYHSVHSEFDALRQVWGEDLSGVFLVNVRILRTGKISLSRPCRCCTRMLIELGIRDIYYTRRDGAFEHIII